jgi:UDP-N-acetylmuramoyl-tripeptide--D-alanyl-D-alanine ligase
VARVEGVDAPLTNVACAVAVAIELGVAASDIAHRLATLPVVEHRLSTVRGGNGCAVIDDTYNSNPAGSRLALAALGRGAGNGGRKVVVTPGMVELGSRQADENAAFAADVADVATDLVVVGRTNRAALLAGVRAASRPLDLVLVDDREQAAAWVREHLGPGDVVLYENDLPDHFA